MATTRGGSALEDASLAELAERVARSGAAGDREVEGEVCRRFASRIRLYGLKHLRDDERVRELVQLVLIAVIEALRARRVDEPQYLERYVLGVCRHVAGRMQTGERRVQPTDDGALERAAELSGAVQLPAVAGVDVQALMDCMGKLELRAQTVLHLSFFRDKTADEIAVVLGTSAGNVRVLRHRAIAQMRDCMEVPYDGRQ